MTTQLFDCRFVVLHPIPHLLFIKILMSSSVLKKKSWLVVNIVYMLSHVCCLVFLLTVLFCRLVRSYTKLEVDPPKLHRLKNVLRITINQIKYCCAFIILLTRLVGCVRELLLLTTRVVYGSPKTTCIMRYEHYSFRGVYRIV